MRRINAFTLAALVGAALMVLLSMPVYAQDEGDYANIDNDYYADGYAPRHQHAGYEKPYQANSYQPTYGYGHHRRHHGGHGGYDYPRSRQTCVYGPIREKKVCDYRPRYCWKERECYYIYGKKYCRHFTRCKGGDRYCYWAKPHGGGHSHCY